MSFEPLLTRGAAAALLALGSALPLAAQAGGAVVVRARDKDTVFVRARDKDSVLIRIIDPSTRIRVDSIFVLNRALEEESPASARSLELRRNLEVLFKALDRSQTERARSQGRGGARIVVSGGPESMRQFEARLFNGWIGFTTGSVPHADTVRDDNFFVRYFAYPSIASVEPNSPAQRAGIVPGDVLVAYDGADVVGREINVTQLLVPDRKLSVTVRRDGESRDFAMTVEKAPPRIFFRRLEPGEMPPFPPPGGDIRIEGVPIAGAGGGGASVGGMRGSRAVPMGGGRSTYDYSIGGMLMPSRGMSMAPDAVFGASLISLKPELAAALKLEMGVLVEQVPEETPAYRAGLRAGDVITNVAGVSVSTVREVRVLSVNRGAESRSISLQIVRDKKPKQLTVKW